LIFIRIAHAANVRRSETIHSSTHNDSSFEIHLILRIYLAKPICFPLAQQITSAISKLCATPFLSIKFEKPARLFDMSAHFAANVVAYLPSCMNSQRGKYSVQVIRKPNFIARNRRLATCLPQWSFFAQLGCVAISLVRIVPVQENRTAQYSHLGKV